LYPETGSNSTTEQAQAAEQYLRAGLRVIPLPSKSKNPNRPGWQNERVAEGDVARRWAGGENVGVLLGAPSGGLVDVDLDTVEARAVAPYLLPRTRTSGRAGRPAGHMWYRTDPIPPTKDYKLPGKGDDRSIVELRSTGRQTIIPPSLHPEGERIEWGGEEKVAEIDDNELLERVADVATDALLVHNWPGRGSRHAYVLAATGYLARNLPRERLGRIMEAAICASGDEEASSRLGDVRDTLRKVSDGHPTTGGPTLDGLAPGVADQLQRWYGWRSVRYDRPDGEYKLTDLGNAHRLVDRYGADLRWCDVWGKWLVWTGRRWEIDRTRRVEAMAKEVVRSIYGEAERNADEATRKSLAEHAK
jgi:hypothetical protein